MYTYEKFNVRLMPWFLLILATYFTISGMYLEAGLFGTPGGIFAISFRGFKIDTVNRRIRHYDRFLWFYVGKWKEYSAPKYVTVARVKLTAKKSNAIAFVMPEGGKSSQTFKMNLVVEGRQRFIPLTRGGKQKLINEALKIGHLLDIRVLDYTSPEKLWLK